MQRRHARGFGDGDLVVDAVERVLAVGEPVRPRNQYRPVEIGGELGLVLGLKDVVFARPELAHRRTDLGDRGGEPTVGDAELSAGRRTAGAGVMKAHSPDNSRPGGPGPGTIDDPGICP